MPRKHNNSLIEFLLVCLLIDEGSLNHFSKYMRQFVSNKRRMRTANDNCWLQCKVHVHWRYPVLHWPTVSPYDVHSWQHLVTQCAWLSWYVYVAAAQLLRRQIKLHASILDACFHDRVCCLRCLWTLLNKC